MVTLRTDSINVDIQGSDLYVEEVIGGNAVATVYTVNNLPIYVSSFASGFLIDCDLFFASFPSMGSISSNYDVLRALNPVFTFVGTYFEAGRDVHFDLESACIYYGYPYPSFPVITPLTSLNGNGCEFMDGKPVTVLGRNTIYSVTRSYMGLVTDNSYTTFYDLSATTGEKLTVPEALLTLYVAPIVTP